MGALTHAETSGLSVYREDFASDEEMERAAAELLGSRRDEDPGAGIHGVLVFHAGAIKAPWLPVDGRSAYCFAGTPLLGRPSHIDAFMRMGVAGNDKAPTRRHAYDLVALGFQKLSDYRGGILQKFAAIGAP